MSTVFVTDTDRFVIMAHHFFKTFLLIMNLPLLLCKYKTGSDITRVMCEKKSNCVFYCKENDRWLDLTPFMRTDIKPTSVGVSTCYLST